MSHVDYWEWYWERGGREYRKKPLNSCYCVSCKTKVINLKIFWDKNSADRDILRGFCSVCDSRTCKYVMPRSDYSDCEVEPLL